VTNGSQIQRAVDEVDTLDILINNAGHRHLRRIWSNLDVLEQTFAVNFLGLLKVTNAFLPLLKRSKGPSSTTCRCRARSPTDHTFLLSIKGRRAQLDAVTERALGRPRRDVHAVVLGPRWTPI